MKPILAEQPVSIQVAVSGGTPIAPPEIDFGSISAGASSEIQNVILKFTDTAFDGDAVLDGIYNPTFWIENMPVRADLEMKFLLVDAATFGTTPLVGGLDVPRVYQTTELLDKATKFDNVANELSFLQLQIDAGTNVPNYDTAEQHRSDPRLVYQWDRESAEFIDAFDPNANSDHLWEFSQIDMYATITRTVDIGGTPTTFTQRHLIGWIADEDIEITMGHETVEFLKGKPQARAVRFLSAINAMTAVQIASCDPWIIGELLHLPTVLEDRQFVWTEQNKQRPIKTLDISFEWNVNDGKRVRLSYPKAQLFITGSKIPGGGEIAKMAFEVTPLVDAGRNTVYKLFKTQRTTQQAQCPLVFDLNNP